MQTPVSLLGFVARESPLGNFFTDMGAVLDVSTHLSYLVLAKDWLSRRVDIVWRLNSLRKPTCAFTGFKESVQLFEVRWIDSRTTVSEPVPIYDQRSVKLVPAEARVTGEAIG